LDDPVGEFLSTRPAEPQLAMGGSRPEEENLTTVPFLV
ncbi:hypothetical protein A2U01_0093084, partial [Trifolium medium]|nr:hypothetical protein [Trifolium medium]